MEKYIPHVFRSFSRSWRDSPYLMAMSGIGKLGKEVTSMYSDSGMIGQRLMGGGRYGYRVWLELYIFNIQHCIRAVTISRPVPGGPYRKEPGELDTTHRVIELLFHCYSIFSRGIPETTCDFRILLNILPDIADLPVPRLDL